MSLPKHFMDELRSRISLSDIIGKRIKITRAGREYKACCPFHKEKTPSFTINNEKNFYHCFGCGAHGDAIKFIMDYQNMGFMEAVEYLAGVAGVQVPEQEMARAKEESKKRKSLYELMEAVARYYRDQLFEKKNKKYLQYLTDRGFSLKAIKAFGIGYAPYGDDSDLQDQLLAEGFTREDLLTSGVFKNSQKKQGQMYPFFRHRIIFPVMDLRRKVVAFGGRTIPENYGGSSSKSAPKYINSPESPIFHKGRLLYGLGRARRSVGDGDRVVVVEGYMDVMALVQSGFNSSVAPLGTALTETQILELWKLMPDENKVPILCFDGDNAGQRAASRAIDRILPILKPDCSVRFAFLPKGHDPDSLIKAEGVSAMDLTLKSAISLFDMMWREEAGERDLAQPEARAGLKRALIKRARQIEDKSIQETYINQIEHKFNDLYSSKRLAVGSGQKRQFKGYNQPPPGVNSPYRPSNVMVKGVKSPQARQFERMRVLLAMMINHPELYDEFGESFGTVSMGDAELDDLRQEIIILLEENKNLDFQYVREHLSSLGYKDTLEKIFDQSLYLHAGFAKPEEDIDVVRSAWQEIWERGFINR